MLQVMHDRPSLDVQAELGQRGDDFTNIFLAHRTV